MRTGWFVLPVVVAASMLLAAGGAPAQADSLKQIEINVTSNQSFQVLSDVTDLKHLAKKLKSAGATGDTEVRIQLPGTPTAQFLSETRAVLQKAGYLKILFILPRKTEVGLPHETPSASPVRKHSP